MASDVRDRARKLTRAYLSGEATAADIARRYKTTPEAVRDAPNRLGIPDAAEQHKAARKRVKRLHQVLAAWLEGWDPEEIVKARRATSVEEVHEAINAYGTGKRAQAEHTRNRALLPRCQVVGCDNPTRRVTCGPEHAALWRSSVKHRYEADPDTVRLNIARSVARRAEQHTPGEVAGALRELHRRGEPYPPGFPDVARRLGIDVKREERRARKPECVSRRPLPIDPARLVELRAGRSIRSVAIAAGVSPAKLAAYERGDTRPAIRNAIRLATFYGVSVDDLTLRDKA